MATKPNTIMDIEYEGHVYKYDRAVMTKYGFAKALARGSNKIYDYMEQLFCGKDEEYAEKLVETGAPDNDAGESGALALLVEACYQAAGLGN